tara:strand:- start:145 stop:1038 length:894 start_codon:yes stop_codon:yes gene_type:complete
MAKNPHFKPTSTENNLIDDLTIESIQIYGHDMVYIPRVTVDRDTLFGEDILSKFTEANTIEMYIDTVDGFQGEGDFISKFGLEIRDSIDLVVSRKRFEEVLGHDEKITRPREGDLIYFPLSKGLFEIKFVEHENPFYQLGRLYVYKLSCELFTYSQEEIDTGYDDVDVLEDDKKQFAVSLTLGTLNSVATDYYIGETVYQGTSLDSATAVAVVTGWVNSTKKLEISNISGTFDTSSNVVGSTSTTDYDITTKETTTVIVPQGISGDAGDNAWIEFEVDKESIFDFTDTDPFSEGNYS